jgi:glutamine synthetase
MTISTIYLPTQKDLRFLSKVIVRVSPYTHFLHAMTSSADTETGPGVFETALAYTTAFRMADNALLFKYLVKSLGMKHGIMPSFMAKPWGNVSVSFASVFFFFLHQHGRLLQLPGCSGFVKNRVIL